MGRILVAVAVTAAFLAAAPAASADAQVDRGIAVYKAQKCNLCHIVAGEGKKHVLDGVGTKLSAEDIRQWLVDITRSCQPPTSTRSWPT
jgi:mono/diheme cytochrome c family protein